MPPKKGKSGGKQEKGKGAAKGKCVLLRHSRELDLQSYNNG